MGRSELLCKPQATRETGKDLAIPQVTRSLPGGAKVSDGGRGQGDCLEQYNEATSPSPSHPNDEKEGFFPRNHSSSSMNSIVGNHHHNHTTDTCVPLMGEERIEMADAKAHETECKEVRITWGGGLPLLFSLPRTTLWPGTAHSNA